MKNLNKTVLFLFVASLLVAHSYAQSIDPIEKRGLLAALKHKELTSRDLVGQVRKRGVTFGLNNATEREIREAGKYLGKKGLDDLIAAVRVNYRSAAAELEGPTFIEDIDNCSLVFGGNTAVFSLQLLRSTRLTPFTLNGVAPIVYVEDNRFYADVKLLGPDNKSLVEVRRNHLTVTPLRWDSARSKNAFEVVNEQGDVVFQIIYKKPSTIIINGIFPVPNRLGWVTYFNELRMYGAIPATEPPPQGFPLKAIFRYPTWKYHNEYALTPAEPKGGSKRKPSWTQIDQWVRSLYPEGTVIDRIETVDDSQCRDGCQKCRVVLKDSHNQARNEFVTVTYSFANGAWEWKAVKQN